MKKKVSQIQLIVLIIACIIGNTMLILSMTNFLTESFFKGTYLVLYILIFGSIFTAYEVAINYLNASRTK
jgi:hypothetical protein